MSMEGLFMPDAYKNCLVCGSKIEPLYKVYFWDKPDKYNYFCQKHYKEVEHFQIKQRDDFNKAYIHPDTRAWLSPSNLELWERLHKLYG